MTKIILGALIAIAFVAGTIMTGTLVDAAKPEQDPDKDGELEGIGFEIIGILLDPIFGLEEIKNEVRNIEEDVEMIQSDIDLLETDISMIKSDVSTIKDNTDEVEADLETLNGKVDNIPEPLTKFDTFQIVPGADNTKVTTITSTGPMLVDICSKIDTGVTLFKVLPNTSQHSVSDGHACLTAGVNVGETLLLTSNPAFNNDSTFTYVSIRTTPSATLDIQTVTTPIP